MPNQKYRSKLEAKVAESLVDWEYESTTVKYSVPRTYTPDFTKGRVYIEVKGFFRVGDTQKYKAIHKQLKSEGKVLVFVWSDAHKRIRKGAKLTNAKWCDKEGIVWFDLSEIKELKKWSKQYV
jgi:hypothetical protein